MYVQNESVSSCCGQPSRQCSCGGRHVNNEKLPAGGSLTDGTILVNWESQIHGDDINRVNQSHATQNSAVVNGKEQPAGGSLSAASPVW